MENMLNYLFNASDKVLSNAMNIYGNYPNHFVNELEDSIELEIPIPGFTREELDIQIEDGNLHVETNSSFKEGRWTNSFKKVFRISNSLNTKKINAKLENGILKISLPKLDKAKKVNISID
jgi:HSP20 family protein